MPTWYKASMWNGKIAPVEVERETNNFVVIKGIRSSKDSYGEWYRPTFDEARNILVDCYRHKVNGLKDDLLRAEQDLTRAMNLSAEGVENA
jgi:hypothetical protein